MKIKAALMTAVLGASTAAMASPRWTDGFETTTTRPDHGTTWISLAEPLRLEDGRDVILPELGSFWQIRLQAATGFSFIESVTVRYTDGSVQRQMFDQWLTNQNPMVQFDLEPSHRGIAAIVVRGTARGRSSSYQVFAQGSPAGPQEPRHRFRRW